MRYCGYPITWQTPKPSSGEPWTMPSWMSARFKSRFLQLGFHSCETECSKPMRYRRMTCIKGNGHLSHSRNWTLLMSMLKKDHKQHTHIYVRRDELAGKTMKKHSQHHLWTLKAITKASKNVIISPSTSSLFLFHCTRRTKRLLILMRMIPTAFLFCIIFFNDSTK